MKKWWEECVIYQVYPRSFCDSNGDGIGDIPGITGKLDYLKALGVGAVWLSPVYDSPNDDMGYDIRDYRKIMQEFGTMEDFKALLAGLHERGMKLIMDLVVNHSSDEHEWFRQASSSRENPYRDYYIWRDGKNGREPNNWAGFFSTPAWKYDERTQQWYLHLFSEKQPDLNWENPKLRAEIYDMINFWLDMGVDGFRMDVIPLLAKNQEFPDAGPAGDETEMQVDSAEEAPQYVFGGEHIVLQPRLHDYLREMREKCFDGRDCMCVGEGTCVSIGQANSLLEDGRELDQLFQFDLMDVDGGASKWDLVPLDTGKLKRKLFEQQEKICRNTLFWSNHDQPRAVSRFGCTQTEELWKRSAKMLAAAMHLMKGTSYLFQGEELGMTNFPFADETELRDIESINFLKEAKKAGTQDKAWESILVKGRDNARTPMQWDETKNAGFSAGTPWIAVNPNYTYINAEIEQKDEDSVLNFYRKVIALKTGNAAFSHGDCTELLADDARILAYVRACGEEKYLVMCNMTGETAKAEYPVRLKEAEIVLHNMDDVQEWLRPYEAVVCRL